MLPSALGKSVECTPEVGSDFGAKLRAATPIPPGGLRLQLALQTAGQRRLTPGQAADQGECGRATLRWVVQRLQLAGLAALDQFVGSVITNVGR